MTTVALEVDAWSEQQFGDCDLGDRRRTRRAVKLAAQVAANPSGSTPKQTGSWADCKSAYRLFDNDAVTFDALASPHWQRTRARVEGTWLVLNDTTEVEFGIHRQVKGLGPTGNGRGRGFLLHSALMVRAGEDEIAGLAGQVIRYRRPSQKERNGAQRLKRQDRETAVWGQVVDMVGTPPNGAQFIHVCDRGGDHFEAYCHLVQNRAGWVVRAAQQHRIIVAPDNERKALSDYVEELPVAGSLELEVPTNKKQRPRTATLEVRFGPLRVPRPAYVSKRVKSTDIHEIDMWVVDVREVDPPRNAEPLHWVLLTSEPVASFDESWTIISHYEQRPLIEEFHRALKSGCRLEQRFYASADRLEAVTALLCIVAVRLLQLRTAARHQPDRPARQFVPPTWLAMLQAVRKTRTGADWTIRQFYRELAKLGGFLARKSDGEPGWITLWRGFEQLHLLVRGAEAMSKKCG